MANMIMFPLVTMKFQVKKKRSKKILILTHSMALNLHHMVYMSQPVPLMILGAFLIAIKIGNPLKLFITTVNI